MSIYNLSPAPQIHENFSFWTGGFSESEIYKIREMGENLIPNDATIGENLLDGNVRRSKISWLTLNSDTNWIYEKLGYIARMLNGQYFQFDITGFNEHLQYTVYQSNDDGFYDWHVDGGYDNSRPPRKLSLVIQLSDPSEYEGGELEFRTGSYAPVQAKKEMGIVYAFPSFLFHRVTPVTKGVRRSLVIWLSGPRFR